MCSCPLGFRDKFFVSKTTFVSPCPLGGGTSFQIPAVQMAVLQTQKKSILALFVELQSHCHKSQAIENLRL